MNSLLRNWWRHSSRQACGATRDHDTRLLGASLLMIGLSVCVGCGKPDTYPSRPITLVCPWAAGGGTDRVSRQMAMLLEQELGEPVNVINATGGKGVTGHNRGLNARPDGYTLTMMTFELNTMHWTGLTDLTYQDCIPLVSVNEDYAALLVRADASWQTLEELESDVRKTPKKLTASGTAIGGAWHLALAGWLVAADFDADDIVWIPSQGANPSLQQLVSGGVDMVCCSLPEARTLVEAGQVRALGLMAPERANGFEDVKTFREQGRDWTLGGWRGLAVPKNTPPEVVDRLVEVIQRIVSQDAQNGNFAEFMQTQKFDNTWRGPEEFVDFLASTDEKLGLLLKSDAMRSVSQDRFSPMAYPYALIGLIGITMAGLCIAGMRLHAANEIQKPDDISGGSGDGFVNFALIITAVVAYALLAEAVGFVVIASAILLMMLIKLGTRVLPSVLIVIAFVPTLYFMFAYVLRVPLPRGWLG